MSASQLIAQRFRINDPERDLLGRGGMGAVYRATDTQTGELVAVKALNSQVIACDPDLVERFRREGEALDRLNHPNIVRMVAAVQEQGQHYLVIEYMSGGSLADVLTAQGRLPSSRVIEIALDLADALTRAHRLGIIHRDLKPANVLLAQDGTPRLADFGIAHAASDQRLTQTGILMGTVDYLSPEVCQGEPPDERADIWSFGVMLFQMLSGRLPFEGKSITAMLTAILTQPVPDLAQLAPDVPDALIDLVYRMLTKDPQRRIPSVRLVGAELEAIQKGREIASARPSPAQSRFATPAAAPREAEQAPIAEMPQPVAASQLRTHPSYTVTLNIAPPPEPSLPPTVVDFVGREKELAAFADMLAARHLAVIIGMPGVGKTALLAELAKRRESSARTFWHSFHEGEGVTVLIWKLAAFLACHHQPDLWSTLQGSTQGGGQAPPSEVLLDYAFQMVRGRDYVLCLDDFHYVDADPLLSKLVERLQPALDAGQVDVIIATQRRPPFVLESVVRSLGGLTRDDARLLLDERKLALPEAALSDLYACTEGNAELLVLAIDALRRASDCARVLSRLGESEQIERFLVKEVDGGLSDEERQVMSAVATLLGYPGTRDAIAVALDGASVRRPLNDLVSRSLITVMEGESGKEYTLNTLVRAYYYDLLSQAERQAMHQRLGEHYVAESPDVLRAALHFEAAKQVERAAQLATADVMSLINLGRARQLADLLSRFVARQMPAELWGRVNLARGQVHAFLRNSELAHVGFQTALDTLDTLPADPSTRELVAQACRGMGSLLEFEAPAAALEWLQRGLQGLGQANREEEAALYIQLYKIHGVMGNYDAAMEAVQKGLALLPDRASQLRMQGLKGVGNIYALRGEIETGNQYMRQALDVAQQLHDHYQMAGILYNLGYDRFYLCDWPGAEGYFRQALALTERLGDMTRQVHTRNMMGMLYTNRGDDATANTFLTQALALARQGKLRLLLPYVLNSLADLQLRQSQWDAAELTLTEAEHLALEMQIKWPLVDLYAYRACASLAKLDLGEALAMAERSVALARELDLKDILGNSLRVLGQTLQASGQFPAAQQTFEQSLALLANAPYEAARTKLHWGLALKSAKIGRGTQLMQEARATFAQLGAQRELKQADELLSE